MQDTETKEKRKLSFDIVLGLMAPPTYYDISTAENLQRTILEWINAHCKRTYEPLPYKIISARFNRYAKKFNLNLVDVLQKFANEKQLYIWTMTTGGRVAFSMELVEMLLNNAEESFQDVPDHMFAYEVEKKFLEDIERTAVRVARPKAYDKKYLKE